MMFHLIMHYFQSLKQGTMFIVAGSLLQLSSFGFIFFFSIQRLPQMIISTIIIGFISYFAMFRLDHQLHDFIHKISSNKVSSRATASSSSSSSDRDNSTTHHHRHHHFLFDAVFTLLEYIDGVIMRRICISIFFILPIIMEMRALILLSSLVTESIIKNNYTKSFLVGWSICWSFVIVQLLVFIPMHFHTDAFSY